MECPTTTVGSPVQAKRGERGIERDHVCGRIVRAGCVYGSAEAEQIGHHDAG